MDQTQQTIIKELTATKANQVICCRLSHDKKVALGHIPKTTAVYQWPNSHLFIEQKNPYIHNDITSQVLKSIETTFNLDLMMAVLEVI